MDGVLGFDASGEIKEEVYYTGFLVADIGDQPKREKTGQQLAAMAKRDEAWKLHEKGLVNLVQRRVAPFVFDYIMQWKTRK